MIRNTLGLGLALLFIALATTSVTAQQSTPLQQLAWLPGGTWSADASKLPGPLDRIDVHYDTPPSNPSVIRFTTQFIDKQGNVVNAYAGNMYYDESSKQLMIWYIDSANHITTGPMTIAGNLWTITFKSPGDIVGRPGLLDFTVTINRQAEAYHWSLAVMLDGAQKQLFALDYRHKP